MTWADLVPLGTELILLVGALSLLAADLILPPGDKRILSWGAFGVLAIALVGTFIVPLEGPALGGAYVADPLGIFFKRIFLGAGLLAVLATHGYGAEAWTRRQGEYYLLMLFSVVGMCLLSGTRDLILLVVAFELMGIPLYAMAAWLKTDARAVEGSFKLYLVGAVSSATVLYGVSLLFGSTGSTELAAVARAESTPLLMLGGAVALAGMGFKIGVFPFHMWVPDTYQGAPTPFITFLAVGPKAAGMVALVQLLLGGGLVEGVSQLLLIVCAVTLVLGTLLALRQDNIKRLLGFSGVAHMGFLLMALATGETEGLATLLFYLAAYLFTNVGAFLVVHAVHQSGGDDSLTSFDGLGRRSYWLSMAMLAFLLSLAGIPFVVGFWAKLYVFVAAWKAGFAWLVVLGAMVAVLGLFYYLRVARAMFMNEPVETSPVQVEGVLMAAIVLCVLMVVVLGIVPGPLVDAARAAATAFLG